MPLFLTLTDWSGKKEGELFGPGSLFFIPSYVSADDGSLFSLKAWGLERSC